MGKHICQGQVFHNKTFVSAGLLGQSDSLLHLQTPTYRTPTLCAQTHTHGFMLLPRFAFTRRPTGLGLPAAYAST